MAIVRNAHLTRLLIGALGACSSGSPSTSGPVNGVVAVEFIPCDNGQCVNENIADVALEDGGALVARVRQGGSGNVLSTILRANFDDGGVATLTDDTSAFEAYVGVLGGGAELYVAESQSVNQLTVHPATGGFGSSAPSGGGILVGSLGAGGAFYFASGSGGGGPNGNGNGDINAGIWPSGIVIDGGIAANPLTGKIQRFDADGGFAAPLDTDFLATYSRHLLATDGTNVYWIAGPEPGTVMSAPMDLSTKTAVTTIPKGVATGVAANATKVVWATTSFGSPPLCAVGSGGTTIFETTAFSCVGLAVDGTHAWFAVAKLAPLQGNGGNGSNTYLAGTALARVDLAGPATQSAAVVDVSSTRWYGPRRVLVDDTYVYGVDPSYVARVAKATFK